MDRFSQQATIALQTFVERGAKVIQVLEAGDWDEAMRLLRLRKAAFLNYRTAETLADLNKHNFYSSKLAQDLWGRIEDQETKLVELLNKHRKAYVEQLARVKKEKVRISKYRSHAKHQTTFARSI